MNFGELLEIEESQKKEIKRLREENKKLTNTINKLLKLTHNISIINLEKESKE